MQLTFFLKDGRPKPPPSRNHRTSPKQPAPRIIKRPASKYLWGVFWLLIWTQPWQRSKGITVECLVMELKFSTAEVSHMSVEPTPCEPPLKGREAP